MSPAPRAEFYRHMDAANVDLKAFTEEFYRKVTASRLEPVKDTLRYLVRETRVWTEITTLLIPGLNDSDAELTALAEFVAGDLGVDVPVHFSAFHPDYRMRDIPATPLSTLRRAREIARRAGLRYVYTGNVHDPEGDATPCPGCGSSVLERDWYEILGATLTLDAPGHGHGSAHCAACGTQIAGRFGASIGSHGRRRMRVVMK
jgi:pyruvate formate lyase activating enzyme